MAKQNSKYNMESWWYYIYQNIRDVSVKAAYTNELVSPAETTTYEDEIGLIYVSDYMYAVNPMGWTTVGDNNSVSDYSGIKGDNWMYTGDTYWTITRSRASNDVPGSLVVSFAGSIGWGDTVPYAVRPAFYLNSDVEFSGGTGTLSDPYVIV